MTYVRSIQYYICITCHISYQFIVILFNLEQFYMAAVISHKNLIFIIFYFTIWQKVSALNFIFKNLISNSDNFGIEIINSTYNNSVPETTHEIKIKEKKKKVQKMLQYSPNIVNELYEHFTINEPAVITLGSILIQVKELANKKHHRNRIFGHDVNKLFLIDKITVYNNFLD